MVLYIRWACTAVKAAKMTAATAAAGNEGVYLYRLKLKPSAASALAVVPSEAIIKKSQKDFVEMFCDNDRRKLCETKREEISVTVEMDE